MRVLAILCLAATAAFASAAEPERYAFIVGVDRYKNRGFEDLKFAEADAKSQADAFRKLGFKVTLLLGAEATRQRIADGIDRFLQPVTKNDVVVVSFCGHGMQLPAGEGKGKDDAFYCPQDAVFREAGTLFSLSRLTDDTMMKRGGKNLLLVDACRDEPGDPDRGFRGVQGTVVSLPENTAILFACRSGQRSYESAKLGHGLFTDAVLKGLEGAATSNGDVSWTRLAAHVEESLSQPEYLTLMPADRRQEPLLSGQAGRVVLGRMAKSEATPKPEPPTFPYSESEARSYQRRYAEWAKKPLEVKGVNGTELVLIPPGSFMMGNEDSVEDLLKLFPYGKKEWFEDAQPRRIKRITQPFYLGKYEVTRGEFRRFVEAKGYQTEGEKDGRGGYGWTGKNFEQKPEFTWKNTGFEQDDRHPVVNVSWNDAQAYVEWMNGKGEGRYRLPWESEWEYACRAGSGTRFLRGDDQETLKGHANLADAAASRAWRATNHLDGDDGHAFSAPVGSFGEHGANGFGLSDMLGNAREWCEDRYDSDFYASSEESDPHNPSNDMFALRVLRGGGWLYNPARCRAASRDGAVPSRRVSGVGFRVVRDP